jgi:hypothetical protein
VWIWIGKGLAGGLLIVMMLMALGAMWSIVQEYWVYGVITIISGSLWLLAGWFVTRKSRKHG